MSSIHILNKNTDSKRGSGLPFYDKLEYLFSISNNDFHSALGLWSTPNERIPTFQLWQPYSSITGLKYKNIDGNGNFQPANDIIYIPTTFLSLVPVVTNGVQEYIITSLPNVPLSPIPPNGRWIIEIEVTEGENTKKYYSEGFTTKDCC